MVSFISRRSIQGLLTVLAATFLTFIAMRSVTDPVLFYVPPTADADMIERVRESLGLADPIYTQYGRYLTGLIQGNFGLSVRTNQPVAAVLVERLGNSARLAGFSMVLALLLSVPLALIAAVRHHRHGSDLVTRGIGVVAVIGQSVPSFWLGIILILSLSVTWGITPVGGTGTLMHYVLPGATLATFLMAGFVRLLKSSMLDVLSNTYIQMARSKGLTERRVIWIHGLRNAFIPFLSLMGTYAIRLIGSTVVIETVFNWPGLGLLAFQASRTRDLPTIQGVIIVVVVVAVVINLVVDLLYSLADPRIKINQ